MDDLKDQTWRRQFTSNRFGNLAEQISISIDVSPNQPSVRVDSSDSV